MQIQLRLRQRGLRLFKAGFGLGDFLRTITGAVLAIAVIIDSLARRSRVSHGRA